MKEETKRKIYLTEVALAVIVILAISISFFKPTITGFVSAELYSQNLDLTLTESSSFTISTNEEFTINALRLSGEVQGSGLARVYLKNNNNYILVYSNTEREFTANFITGLAVKDEIKTGAKINLLDGPTPLNPPYFDLTNQKLVAGNFDSICLETCSIHMPMAPGQEYELVVFLDQGTTITLRDITYQIFSE